MAADALIAKGGRLASLSPTTLTKLDAILPRTWSRGNPIDIIGDAPGRRYSDTLAVLLEDEGVDAVLVLNCPTALGSPTGAAQALIEAVRPARARNIYTSWLGDYWAAPARRLFAQARIATYDTPDDAVQGFMHRVRHHRNQDLLMQVPPTAVAFTPDAGTARHAIERALAAGSGSTQARWRAFLPPTASQCRGRALSVTQRRPRMLPSRSADLSRSKSDRLTSSTRPSWAVSS